MKKHSNLLGKDLDPKNDMELKPREDGDVDVRYKNGKMSYDEYVDEVETRANNQAEGKPLTSSTMGYFAGFGKGTLKKPYKENN